MIDDDQLLSLSDKGINDARRLIEGATPSELGLDALDAAIILTFVQLEFEAQGMAQEAAYVDNVIKMYVEADRVIEEFEKGG